MIKVGKYLAILAAIILGLGCVRSAQAQIILTTGEYRIVVVDKAEQRLGIAELDANPNRRQNWVYVKYNTELMRRATPNPDDGEFRYEKVSWVEFFNDIKKGSLITVHGGRDWDRSINAKKIWYKN